jgi:elongation factor 2
LNARRGIINTDEPIMGTNLTLVKAYLPVAESFGFTSHLRAETSGKAFPQCVFDHWQLVSGNALEAGSKANDTVLSIRTRKGLEGAIPTIDKYWDKL